MRSTECSLLGRYAVVCAAISACLLAPSALAQQRPPDAGTILKEVTPPRPPSPPPAPGLPQPEVPAARPAAPQSTVSFKLEALKFNGNTVFSSETLALLAADKIGKTVTLADLDELAARITARYHEQGYFLAQAIIPRQEIRDGVVEMSIVEGRIGKLRINRAADAPISEARLAAILSALKPGEPIKQAPLERAMLILSDVPGIEAQSSLEEGEQAGSADLIVEVNPRKRASFAIDGDNYGLRASGEFRVGASLRVNSPLEYGDNLDLRAMKSSGGGISFGRVGYELPVAGDGARLGLGLARLEYVLGEDFAQLGASGNAVVADASLNYPIIRSRARNLFGRVSYEHKRLQDNLATVDSQVGKRLRNWGAGLVYELRDSLWGGGYWSASATVYAGKLTIDDPQASDLDQSASGKHTAGGFTKLAYQFSRLQNVSERSNLFLGLSGQWASKNLDSAEKIALGGPRGVRAYPSSEAVADEGQILTLEYRYSVNPEWTVTGFYDAGWAKVDHDPLPAEPENNRSLRGYGVGLYWGLAGEIALQASLAWRQTAAARSDGKDRNPRLYVQAVKTF
jgi:hemolysin activation/secretion protein